MFKEKKLLICITNAKEYFWMWEENQSDWEKVKIDKTEVLRDGGSITYYFKENGELHIPFKKNPTCHISGDSKPAILERIPLSKQKLQEIGITNKVNLDLSNLKTINDAEQALTKKLDKSGKLPARRLVKLFENNMDRFLDTVSKDSQKTSETSEPGSSAGPRFSN